MAPFWVCHGVLVRDDNIPRKKELHWSLWVNQINNRVQDLGSDCRGFRVEVRECASNYHVGPMYSLTYLHSTSPSALDSKPKLQALNPEPSHYNSSCYKQPKFERGDTSLWTLKLQVRSPIRYLGLGLKVQVTLI